MSLAKRHHIVYANAKNSKPLASDQTNKIAALEAELAAYRRQAQQAQQIQQQAQTPPPPRVNKDVAEQMKKAIKLRAKRLSGFSDEDIDALEYMDEDDERYNIWQSSLKMAENDVYASMQAAEMERRQAAIAFLEEHEKSVKAFNEAWAKEQANPDYMSIYKYADDINGYAAKIPEQERRIVYNAAIRVTNQTASPQDMYIVRKYFEAAKADFYKNGKGGINRNSSAPKKPLPRSSGIDGTTISDSVTADQLKTMLMTKNWRDIPQTYRDLMEGITSSVK